MSPPKSTQETSHIVSPCDDSAIPSVAPPIGFKPESQLSGEGFSKQNIYSSELEIKEDELSIAPSYSVFTTTQKKWIVFIAASAGWFSTASSFIYFPAIPFLARDLDVSIQKINLTVTSYLVASGIFPALVGSAADQYGRRPVFIVAIGTYIAINVGLALQRSFPVLITLRMLQSAAISG